MGLAAGALIAREAGARVTTIGGDTELLLPPYSVLAAAPMIYGKILETLKTIP